MVTRRVLIFAALMSAACDDANQIRDAAFEADAEVEADAKVGADAQVVAFEIDVEALALEHAAGGVWVTGSAGAIAPAGARAEVLGTVPDQQFTGAVATDGSFSVLLPGSAADLVQIRALFAGQQSDPVYLFADGRTVSETGLKCDQRTDLARGHMASVAEDVDLSCARDEDCALTILPTACGSECPGFVLAKAAAERVAANRAALDQSLCASFEEACSTPDETCEWLDEVEAKCVQERCQMLERNQPTASVHVVDLLWTADYSAQYEIWIPDANGAPVLVGSWAGRVGPVFDVPLDGEGRPEFILRKDYSWQPPPIANEPGWQEAGLKVVGDELSPGQRALLVVRGSEIQTLNESELSYEGPEMYVHVVNAIVDIANKVPAFGVADQLCVANEPLALAQQWPVMAEALHNQRGFFNFRFYADAACTTPLEFNEMPGGVVPEVVELGAFPGDHVIVVLTWSTNAPENPAFVYLDVAATLGSPAE
jgi:hypothetical protein